MIKAVNVNSGKGVLEHVMNLRKWKPTTGFEASEVFMYPTAREKFDLLGKTRPTFGEASELPYRTSRKKR